MMGSGDLNIFDLFSFSDYFVLIDCLGAWRGIIAGGVMAWVFGSNGFLLSRSRQLFEII